MGGLLSGIGSVLGLDTCTGYLFGSESGCINQLANALDQEHASGGSSIRSGNAFLAGLLFPILKNTLDAVGNNVLLPLLEDVLGVRVGQADVSVMDIQCRDGAHLVH